MEDRADELAIIISVNRAKQIWDEYYEEVTQKTYNRWYVDKNKSGKTRLNAEEHGGSIVVDEKGKSHYFKFSSKKAPLHKVGKKKYMPYRRDVKKAVKDSERLMKKNGEMKVKKTKDGEIISLQIQVENDYVYKGSALYKADTSHNGVDRLVEYRKNGRISKIDKLLVDSIAEWAHQQGNTVVMTLSYEEDQ